jgi:hypothetical protein
MMGGRISLIKPMHSYVVKVLMLGLYGLYPIFYDLLPELLFFGFPPDLNEQVVASPQKFHHPVVCLLVENIASVPDSFVVNQSF